MSLLDRVLRTIQCSNTECNKKIEFDRKDEKAVFDNPANVWLKSIRMVQTLDQRTLVYCSDVCEISGARSGQHNLPEPKRIIEANDQTLKQAAAAADAARQSNENLKSGHGGPVIVAE